MKIGDLVYLGRNDLWRDRLIIAVIERHHSGGHRNPEGQHRTAHRRRARAPERKQRGFSADLPRSGVATPRQAPTAQVRIGCVPQFFP